MGTSNPQRGDVDKPPEAETSAQLALDPFMFGRETTPDDPDQRAARRRRAIQRARDRVPYD